MQRSLEFQSQLQGRIALSRGRKSVSDARRGERPHCNQHIVFCRSANQKALSMRSFFPLSGRPVGAEMIMNVGKFSTPSERGIETKKAPAAKNTLQWLYGGRISAGLHGWRWADPAVP